MLDAYIIERIRREQQQRERDGSFVPLHIPAPRPPDRTPDERIEDRDDKERGSTIIDFHL